VRAHSSTSNFTSVTRMVPRLWAFYIGVVFVMVGVGLHLPGLIGARGHGFMLRGMPMSPMMTIGMVSICAGLVLAGFGLVPRRRKELARVPSSSLRIVPSSSKGFAPAHKKLFAVLLFALIIDTVKPATIGFVLPGMRMEYGLSKSEVALLPLFALTGCVIGSVVWGMIADRVGRRPSILLAAVMFTATAICGAMPSFGWNLAMCFNMGVAAGGMVPTLFALLAESIPDRHRSRWSVLLASLGASGGYWLAAGLADVLAPVSWRFLWLSGIPTGLALILLNRYIPESPRFLLARGDEAGAFKVIRTYGMKVIAEHSDVHEGVRQVAPKKGAVTQLLAQRAYATRAMIVSTLSLSWGLVNYGFLTMLPTMLSDRLSKSSVEHSLFIASIYALPMSLLVAVLYERWGSRRSLVLYALACATALSAFFIMSSVANAAATMIVVTALLVSSGGLYAMLGPYTAELFPTALRGSVGGLGAALGKFGGVVGPPLVAMVAAATGIGATALIVAAPLYGCAVGVAWKGVETSGMTLEEISGAETADLASSSANSAEELAA
jgi:putative MFS transporter